ncbi:MAG: bifunctional UDP-N-acetylglucosamine diphosphorylase/glucosamine-1-phosphate N-acetyltransferase GlmU [Armatimonadetes bacterium]|nr:bifunctional UDP-N-acetylglucosamine diphosphorylase/glucosamine-1-phosphate N-acetyltransferase GlmU [Armatimonadota bacterium]
MEDLAIIILSAGKGTRMKSNLPKTMHLIWGKPILDYVLEEIDNLNIKNKFLVTGYEKEEIKSNYLADFTIVEQKEQLGTAHAVLQTKPYLEKFKGDILVLYGDMPLISNKILKKLLDYHKNKRSQLTLLTAKISGESDFGRIMRNKNNQILKIIEFKDAKNEEKKIKEINLGIYCFKAENLFKFLPQVQANNIKNEFYLTDLIEIFIKNKKNVNVLLLEEENFYLGINTRKDLAIISKIIRKRILEELMLNGVTILDPENVYIDKTVKIAKDTVIYPFTFIEGKTEIGEGCTIGPFSRIYNSKISSKVVIQSSIILESKVGERSKIGPFAFLRPQTIIGKEVKIGDFVEIKKSQIDDFSKIPHLSYIGDAVIGKSVNIGAGTITCNFDGITKHATIIEDGVQIGANTNLVAPLILKKYSKTGAGAVILEDIPEYSLAVGVPAKVKKIKNKVLNKK